jgi:hypothetical protein
MVGMRGVRERFVDSPTSLGAKARARRWEWFQQAFPDIASMSVIDLGGRAESWLRAPVRPAHVCVVNLEQPTGTAPEWITEEQGDACELPEHVRKGEYDLVFSNSVLEHVGGHERRQRFADAVHELAPRHWVQTPYRYFPVEPHFLFPGFQFLPLAARVRLVRHWPLVHTPPEDRATALRVAIWVELLSRTEMAYYFPYSTVRAERLGGLAKSLIAVKTA